jgi:hypothetical protein
VVNIVPFDSVARVGKVCATRAPEGESTPGDGKEATARDVERNERAVLEREPVIAKDDEKESTRDTDVSDWDIARVWSATTRRSGGAIVAKSGELSPNAICECCRW